MFLSGVERDVGGDSVYDLGTDSVAYGGDGESFDNEDESPDKCCKRHIRRDCMLVKSALCDFLRALGDAAIECACACGRDGQSFEKRHYDFMLGLLQGECGEANLCVRILYRGARDALF